MDEERHKTISHCQCPVTIVNWSFIGLKAYPDTERPLKRPPDGVKKNRHTEDRLRSFVYWGYALAYSQNTKRRQTELKMEDGKSRIEDAMTFSWIATLMGTAVSPSTRPIERASLGAMSESRMCPSR